VDPDLEQRRVVERVGREVGARRVAHHDRNRNIRARRHDELLAIVAQRSFSGAALSCAASTAADSAEDSLRSSQAMNARRSISWPEVE